MIISPIRRPLISPEISAVKYDLSLANFVKGAGCVLYLDARKATGYGIPNNTPLTSPWVDLSGNRNDATPTNMAGTTASGVNTSNPSNPFWVLDGSDDFFSLVNTASIDITSAPLAMFLTLKVSVGAGTGYIICKNLDSPANIQYGCYWDSSGKRIVTSLENTARGGSASNSVLENVWCNVGVIWDGASVRHYVNLVQSGADGTCSGTLTSRENLRIGRRETMAGYFKASIATTTIYSGSNATTENILKAEKAISKAYVGG
jgi:hypothetical protein